MPKCLNGLRCVFINECIGGCYYADVTPIDKPDAINQPAHYARWKMQPIEFIAVNDLPFWLANAIKYGCRWDAKDGLQDLYKMRSYVDMKIRQVEGVDRWWEKPVAEERKANASESYLKCHVMTARTPTGSAQ